MVLELTDEIKFPDFKYIDDEWNGLIGIGGDLSIPRLKLAYSSGIFPWSSKPFMWHSPPYRMLLFLEDFKISRSLKKVLKKNKFKITFDTQFEKVIQYCAEVERKEGSTWISDEFIDGYIQFHKAGYAHSVETWFDNTLVGGLYGVSLGGFFCGESMFHLMNDASKMALVALKDKLISWDFDFIDAQVYSSHIEKFGGREFYRKDFLTFIKHSLQKPTKRGKWTDK